MNLSHRAWIPALLSLSLIAPAWAQSVHRGMPSDNLKLKVVAEGGVPTVPFELVNHHVILEMKVNGAGPFRIVLDTGMPVAGLVLYGKDRVEALDLDYDPGMQAAVGGAGGSGKRLSARMAMDQEASMAGLNLSGIPLMVLPPLPDFATYHDGIIGATLFRNFVVEIDPDASLIYLRDPETYRPPADAASLPLEMRGGIPFTSLSVTTTAGITVPVSMAVDLGASHPLSLNAGTVEGLTVPEESIETILGRGLSGEIRGNVGRIAAIDLGGSELRNVVATFPDKEHHSPRGMDSRNGNLGNGIMSRFNITFDYAHDRMLLVPAKRFSDPFEHDMSGLVLRDQEGEGISVQEILPDSPAARAGMQPRDLLVELDGTPVAEIGMYGAKERLRREGAQMTLVYLRDGQRTEVVLNLARLV